MTHSRYIRQVKEKMGDMTCIWYMDSYCHKFNNKYSMLFLLSSLKEKEIKYQIQFFFKQVLEDSTVFQHNHAYF